MILRRTALVEEKATIDGGRNIGKIMAMKSVSMPIGKARVAKPDDPCRYGDLQSPVMEDWR